MRVFMHCEGCARKVKRSLKGFEEVEGVRADCRTHKVVVKGKAAAAEPLRVVDRVQKKTGRKVELLTPLFPPPKDEENKEEKKRKEEEVKPNVEEENNEEPEVIAVLLRVHMHCEACTQQMKKMILKMKGVQSAEA
ncbi:heavy metal-associated isoprenylated plant protein 7-like [Asparagus officinalis]|uniref:heavy metal-associated isoprenylated plant protein 7-like n=1 Tax=Asparagus officinalis TaxID=4686 RepID=UPI00098E7BCF|nr:heavy metal-associated isoprenylated plant protein 7-like [Asparagus officinalis]